MDYQSIYLIIQNSKTSISYKLNAIQNVNKICNFNVSTLTIKQSDLLFPKNYLRLNRFFKKQDYI